MKKAKQAKKTARKVVRKKRLTKAQKAAHEARKMAQAEARLRASLRQVDPYYLDPSLIFCIVLGSHADGQPDQNAVYEPVNLSFSPLHPARKES